MILWYDSTAKANNFYYLRENYFSCKCGSVIFSIIYWDFITLNMDWNMIFMALKERKISIKFIILIDFDICLGFSLYYSVHRRVISAIQNCFRLEISSSEYVLLLVFYWDLSEREYRIIFCKNISIFFAILYDYEFYFFEDLISIFLIVSRVELLYTYERSMN